jgi:hypothetical protein
MMRVLYQTESNIHTSCVQCPHIENQSLLYMYVASVFSVTMQLNQPSYLESPIPMCTIAYMHAPVRMTRILFVCEYI